MLVTKVGNILEEIDVLKDDNVSSEIFDTNYVQKPVVGYVWKYCRTLVFPSE